MRNAEVEWKLQLFGRFVKDPARLESTGLGLALVKQITSRYSMTVTYTCEETVRRHEFTWLFSTS